MDDLRDLALPVTREQEFLAALVTELRAIRQLLERPEKPEAETVPLKEPRKRGRPRKNP